MTDLPDLKIKALVNFPASAIGGAGVEVTKVNGNFVIDLAYQDFAPPVPALPTGNFSALLWDSVSGKYVLVPPSVLAGGISGDAVSDGFSYGRLNAMWQRVVPLAGGTMTGPLALNADPVTAMQAATKQYVDGHAANTNVVINGDFRVNQTGYVSAAALAAGLYGHDQWKAGASGGDYSFTQLKSSTQITIASGKSLIQPIEDRNVVGGSYVLSWTGTAQARAGVNTLTPSGSYAASPLLISGQTAGTVMSVEFNSGTLGTVKLEIGTIATPFIMRPFDQELLTCKRYYEKTYPYADVPGNVYGAGQYAAGGSLSATVYVTTSFGQIPAWQFKAQKRGLPAITVYSPVTGASAKIHVSNIATDVAGVALTIGDNQTVVAVNNVSVVGVSGIYAHMVADARL